jgi:hypothetical protein
MDLLRSIVRGPPSAIGMKLSFDQVALLVVGLIAYFAVLFFVDKALTSNWRPYFRYLATAATVGAFFYVMQKYVPDHDRAVKITKAAIAMAAAAAVFYEAHRKGSGRPIAERWKKFVGIALALAAITCYFNGFRFGYPKYYHRWDQYHYYMGSKYFHELGYDGLYKCGVVAQDELGLVRYRPQMVDADGAKFAAVRTIDMRKEMRDPDKKVRSLGGDNLLTPVKEILAHPEECRDLFSEERWKEYVDDVKFYRIVSGKGYWTDMQKDHGFNPPPVWTIAGKFFAELHPASVSYLQFLATLDILYLVGMFVALYWAFGWRVFAVGAIFWGTQSSAPLYWTGGAFLRQDWLFYSVLSVACIRKRYFKLAGAALVYAGLLRIFPGLVVIGTLVPFVTYIVKKRRMHPDHRQMLLGGVLAAAVLVPTSLWVSGMQGYHAFYRHTIEVHDETPLTNHMGLRVIIAHRFFDFQAGWPPVKLATGKESGRMKYTRDNSLHDPFEIWKDMRNERYHEYRYVGYGLTAATLLAFILIAYRIKSLWVAQCLGQIFIILMSQLTCYYYSFLILSAPLTKLRKQIELGLFGLAAITEIIWMNSYWNDDRYTALTIVSLIFCYVALGMFWRKGTLDPLLAKLGIRRSEEEPEPAR